MDKTHMGLWNQLSMLGLHRGGFGNPREPWWMDLDLDLDLAGVMTTRLTMLCDGGGVRRSDGCGTAMYYVAAARGSTMRWLG